jgi:hypothetical protein
VACGGSSSSSTTTTVAATTTTAVNTSLRGTVTFDGIWTGAEAVSFGKVIAAFNKVYPNVKVNYKPVGNNLTTVLSTALAGGHPPDMADIAQPGFIQQLVDQHKLKPIGYAAPVIAQNYSAPWVKLGTFDGKLYALVFKAADKSLVWYNVPDFKNAGVVPPATWSKFLSTASTLKASGVPAYSIGGSDGWTLTDLFENIYLRTFGPAKYDQLSAHKIKWTDPTVKQALTTMGKVLGDTSNINGGTSGALQYGFNDSVTNAFGSPSKAAMVMEADFVSGVITSSTKSRAFTGFNVFPFPTITAGAPGSAVEIAGDLFVTFRESPAIEAFVKFLATPAAAIPWARQGGFATGNHNVPTSVYPDAIVRRIGVSVQNARGVVFDMSDEQPASFGSTVGQGEWGIFQKFLKTPSDVNGIASQLETAAAAAYKKGK